MTIKKIKVDTSPDKVFLIDSFSRDASAADCIFDLIDNAIDAARPFLTKTGKAKILENGLLQSYNGIEISVEISGDKVSVEDNAGGMTIEALEHSNLRFGQRSSKPYSIGLYGVGLNRAIFKLGEKTQIVTDTGNEKSEIVFDMASYRDDDDEWLVEGEVSPSTGNAGTRIEITKPSGAIQRVISDSALVDDMIVEASVRYCRYLQKGLKLRINGAGVEARDIAVRQGGPFKPLTKSFTLPSGVKVQIEAGQHIEHRFTRESDHDASTNKALTSEYGWSIVCNDRVIIRSNRTPKTGWDLNWHNEFNGFVGTVAFSDPDGRKLPWNTPKNDIIQSNEAYQSVLNDMRAFTQQWRKYISDLKKLPKGSSITAPPPKPTTPTKKKAKPSPKATTKPKSVSKPTGYRTLLPADVNEINCTDKVLALVHEAKAHDVYDARYSALALLRVLFEVCCNAFLIRHKKYKSMLSDCIAYQESQSGKTMSAKEKKEFAPSLSQLLRYLNDNPSDWDGGKGKLLKPSLDKFKNHKKELNSAIHHPITEISDTNAIKIRDEVMPILRHFIEE